jgi:hypothetical protein
MKFIYIINSTIPKAFTNATRAATSLWATCSPITQANDKHALDKFVKDAAKVLKRGATVQPKWRDGCPHIKPIQLS